MPEINATDASRRFADLLDAVEHRGERYVIVRRGHAVARLEPVRAEGGEATLAMLRRHKPDARWRRDLDELRALVEMQER